MAAGKLKISHREARRLALWAQGLWGSHRRYNGKKGTLATLERLGYIQIDTISVIRRTHHHTLWVRQPAYQPDFLHDLQAIDKKVFEYWSHAAAYLPMESYRFSLPRKERIASGERHWFKRDPRVMQYVLDRIRAEGPLQARDFEAPPDFEGKGMWVLKPAKIALEQLFMEGKLMIRERVGFQKVYDLPERVLPDWVDTTMPSLKDWGRHLILQGLKAHGLASLEELSYLRKKAKPVLQTLLPDMLRRGEVLSAKLENGSTYYLLPGVLDQLPRRQTKKKVHLLSPFDNAVIQRKRLQRLFDFDYQLECYVPAAKRIYGYFTLPILWGDRFVGRLDPKADRKKKVFWVRNLDLQLDDAELEPFLPVLAEKLWELARFNACESIEVERCLPAHLQKEFTRILHL